MKNETPKEKKIKEQIIKLGSVLPGTVRTTYLRCGKPTCKCSSKEQEDKHGPYYFWNRKINGKLSSMSLNNEQKILVEKAIKNRNKLEQYVQKLLEISANKFTQSG